jgi:DNA-binding CsgD family transcriptional regulator
MNALTSMSPITASAILGIRADSSREEILFAFRSLASTNHPDRGGACEVMRDLIEARDLLLTSACHHHPQQPSRARLESADAQEMEAFSRRIEVDLADCYLALPRIWNHGLTLDHPRAAKLARGEANRSLRADRAAGVITPPSDGRQASSDSDSDTDAPSGGTWVKVDESQLAACFREKKHADKKWAMTLINPASPSTPVDSLIAKEAAADRVASGLPADPQEAIDAEREAQKKRALALRSALKPRDRQVLDLHVGQGLTFKQIADIVGKTDKAVYASVKRMHSPMRAERERKNWVDEHCSIEKLACGVKSAPVVLDKAGQLGWDLGGAK